MTDAHGRILNLAAACIAAERGNLDIHGDRCDELWKELRAQSSGVEATKRTLKSNAEIEREVAREIRGRIRRSLPDLIAQALDEE